MKPFNLKEYIANPDRKMVTRDGRKVKRILCTDALGDHPIVALVVNHKGTEDVAYQYTVDGNFCTEGEHPLDLFFIPEKHEGWINICRDAVGKVYSDGVFQSEEIADKVAGPHRVTTVKVTWEEY